eukprot:1769276-Pyramimonas_sp.AAC.1
MRLHANIALGTVLVLMYVGIVPAHGNGNANIANTFWDKMQQLRGTEFSGAQLAFVGKRLEATNGMRCNMFGDQDSCQTLPADSLFARVCPNHPLTVDCAFYNEALESMNEDPIASIRAEMEKRGDVPVSYTHLTLPTILLV